MKALSQNLYITYSNQKARDLKKTKTIKPLDRVITLEALIVELFEEKNFEIIIDETIASSIIYKIIQSENIEYFSYLDEDAVSLQTLYSFINKCKRNDLSFARFHSGEKLNAISSIDKAYQEYKKINHLADSADIEERVMEKWDEYFTPKYAEIYVDTFQIEDISYIKSKKQKQILKKLSTYQTIQNKQERSSTTKIIKPSNEVFDNIDEVKTALRITRKLLEDGVKSSEILIVASDIQEYAPLYKLFLTEYELQGYSSLGTPLSFFHNSDDIKIKMALNEYKSKIKTLEVFYEKLNLTLTENTKENIKNSMSILDEKIGIEITEPNQIVGLSRSYEHIIFIGTDINHFPPKTSDNFLYSYDDDCNYFYANNYFTSSQTQLNELKRLSENLYIITATHSGKRELSPSILLDGVYDETIDISEIKSLNQLALEKQTKTPDAQTSAYYKSITSKIFTSYDGEGVYGITATHLSASQINKYLSCPLAYLLSNKLKLKTPNQNEEGFDVMEQGSLMHLCFELFGKYIKENHIKSRDRDELNAIMYDVSIEAYNHQNTVESRGKPQLEENIHHKIFLSTLQAGLKDERRVGLLAKFVEYYIERADEFEYFVNSEFEKEFALDNNLEPYTLKNEDDQNYFIKGFIDRFDNLENQINVIDYKSKKISTKSGKHKDTQEKIDELNDVQLALYILYVKQQYSNKKHYASMLSFKGENPAAHFGELLDEQFDEAYEKKLKEIIFSTKEGIEKGAFGFDNSDEDACGWCDFKFICHEDVLEKNKVLEKSIC